jgi:hypothetical protein
MSTKIVVADLHAALVKAGIPIEGVALNRPGQPGISVDFTADATEDHKASAKALVDAYDQDQVDAAKATTELDMEALINSAKNVADLKALLLKLYANQG